MKSTFSIFIGMLALVVLGACALQSPLESQRRIYFNGIIYTCDEANPFAEAMAVEDGKIIYVGDNAGARVFIRGNTSVEYLQGQCVVPGFVASGAEVSGVFQTDDGGDAEAKIDNNAAVIEILKNYASRGITTVFDLDEAGVEALRLMDGVRKLPLRCYAVRVVPAADCADGRLADRLDVLQRREERFRKDNPGSRVRLEYIRLEMTSDDKGGKNYAEEPLSELVKLAAQKKFDLHISVKGEAALDDALTLADVLRAGKYPANKIVMSYDRELPAHAIARLAALDGIVYIADPVSEDKNGVEMPIYPPAILHKAGISVMLRGGAQKGYAPLDEIAAGVRRVNGALDRETALAACTINGAKMLSAEKKIGSLKVGKSADFVMLDRNLFTVPVEDLKNIRLERTYFQGHLVYLNRKR